MALDVSEEDFTHIVFQEADDHDVYDVVGEALDELDNILDTRSCVYLVLKYS